jgi:hypothetical protein
MKIEIQKGEVTPRSGVIPDRLIFMHIPKTAGSTLHSILRRQFKHDEQLRFDSNINSANEHEFPEHVKKIRLLRGHIQFGYHEKLALGTHHYFTVLREPVARVFSFYNYLLRTPTHTLYEEWQKDRHTLLQIMESGKFLNVDNVMVRMISGNYRLPYGSINEQHLQQALDNLEHHFSIVGLQHYFNEFLMELRMQYGWKSLWYRQRLVSVSDKKENSIVRDSATINAIRAYNKMDELLYNEILRHKEAQYASWGIKFSRKVARFHFLNTNLGRIANRLPFFPPVENK